jgi:hypothetical protein
VPLGLIDQVFLGPVDAGYGGRRGGAQLGQLSGGLGERLRELGGTFAVTVSPGVDVGELAGVLGAYRLQLGRVALGLVLDLLAVRGGRPGREAAAWRP